MVFRNGCIKYIINAHTYSIQLNQYNHNYNRCLCRSHFEGKNRLTCTLMTTKHCVYLKVKRLFIVSCLLSLVDLFVCIFYMDIITYKCLPCRAMPCLVLLCTQIFLLFILWILHIDNENNNNNNNQKWHKVTFTTEHYIIYMSSADPTEEKKYSSIVCTMIRWNFRKIPKRWNDQRNAQKEYYPH